MDNLIRDVRYAVRVFIRSPGTTAAVIATLALGVGANTAMFSVVNGVLLRPLPYPESDRLVMVWETYPPEGLDYLPASAPDFLDWREQSRLFDGMAALAETHYNLTEGGDPERVRGARVSPGLFRLLRVEPFLGGEWLSEEQEAGGDKVVVLSHGLWQRRFGADASLVGKKILIDGEAHTLVGVMPEGFVFPPPFTRDGRTYAAQHEVWVPLVITPQQREKRLVHYLRVVARLRPGVGRAQAQAEMDSIVSGVNRIFPEVHADVGAHLVPLRQQVVGFVQPALLLLLAAVGLVLLVACANVAHLLLARAADREREVAVRAALGAGRSRLIRQSLTESVTLALAGGAAGLLTAGVALDLLLSYAPASVPRLSSIRLDGNALLVTLLASVLTGIVFGLAPAWLSSEPQLVPLLKEGGRGSAEGSRRLRFQNLLVVGEVALALVLVVGAGLLFRSFLLLRGGDPGFRPKNLLVFDLPPLESKYGAERQRAAFYQQVVEQIATLPEVATVGATSHLPLASPASGNLALIEGQQVTGLKDIPTTLCGAVAPDYFGAMGIPLLQGRSFSWLDTEDSNRVVVINQTMARRFWPDRDAVGKRIKQGRPEDDVPWLTIVGVVGDVRQSGLAAEVEPQVYLPRLQRPFETNPAADPRSMTLVIRSGSEPLALVPSIREAVSRLDREVPLVNIRTMEDVVSGSLAERRFSTLLLALFAAIALALAGVGVYGLIACLVAGRAHEMGIRMALGARRADVVGLVVRGAMKWTALGVALGIVTSFAFGRLVSGLFFGVGEADPLSYLGASGVLLLTSFVASYIPARRATAADPMAALKYE